MYLPRSAFIGRSGTSRGLLDSGEVLATGGELGTLGSRKPRSYGKVLDRC